MRFMSAMVLFGMVFIMAMANKASAQMTGMGGMPTKFWVYIGNNSDAILLFQLDVSTGTLAEMGTAAPADKAGFFNFSPDKKYLFAGVGFNGQGGVEGFSVDAKTGKLTAINTQSSAGDEACFVTTDPTGKVALTVNYNAHTVAVLPIGDGGKLSPATCVITLQGSGPNKSRQPTAHAHSINCDPTGKFALVCDLGSDKVWIYKLDVAKGQLTANNPPSVSLPPGSGPRHLTFAPNGKFVYELNEMGGTVAVFAWDGDKGTLTQVQLISGLPDGFSGTNRSAEVQLDSAGKFVYASFRDDTNFITTFSVDQSSGKLTLVGRQPTLGAIPRNFRIDPTGHFLIVANQEEGKPIGSIVMFSIDQKTGKLTPAVGPLPAGHEPICVKFLAVEQ
jgi:6-phosphogluconolactonase